MQRIPRPVSIASCHEHMRATPCTVWFGRLLRPSDCSPHRARLLNGDIDDKDMDELFLSHRQFGRLHWRKHPYTWIRAKVLHTWLPNDCSRLEQFMGSLAQGDVTSLIIFILMLLPVSSTIIFVALFFFMFKEDEVRHRPCLQCGATAPLGSAVKTHHLSRKSMPLHLCRAKACPVPSACLFPLAEPGDEESRVPCRSSS